MYCDAMSTYRGWHRVALRDVRRKYFDSLVETSVAGGRSTADQGPPPVFDASAFEGVSSCSLPF